MRAARRTPAVGAWFIWLLLLVSFLPEHYSIAWDSHKRTVAYVAVLGVLFIVALFLLAKYPSWIVWHALVRSPHIIGLSLSILLSGAGLLLLYDSAGLGEAARSLAYAGSVLAITILLPIAIVRAGVRNWWLAICIIGSIISLLALLSAIGGVTQLLGLQLARDNFVSALGVYSSRAFLSDTLPVGIVGFLGVVGCLYFVARRELTPWLLLALPLCSLGVLVSWSRNAYLALAIGLLAWLVSGSSTSRKFLILGGVVAAMGLTYAALHEGSFLYELLAIGRGLSGREVIWPAAINAALSRPLTGYGFGENVSTAIGSFGGIWFGRGQMAHSSILDMAVAAGLIAAGLYVITILISFIRLSGVEVDLPNKRALSAGLAGMAAATVFITYNLGGIRYMSLAFGIIVGMSNGSSWLWKTPRGQALPRSQGVGLVMRPKYRAPIPSQLVSPSAAMLCLLGAIMVGVAVAAANR